MRLSRQIGLAVLIGAVTEGILMAPLFLMDLSDRSFPVDELARFQYPGAAIAMWVWRAVAVRQYVVEHRMGHDLAVVASAMVLLIQAAIFAVAALGVICIVQWRISKRLLIAVFAPPLAGLLTVAALRFIYYLLSDGEAAFLLSISTVWLAVAVLVFGTTLAGRKNSRAY